MVQNGVKLKSILDLAWTVLYSYVAFAKSWFHNSNLWTLKWSDIVKANPTLHQGVQKYNQNAYKEFHPRKSQDVYELWKLVMF